MYYLSSQSMILLGLFAACTGGIVVAYVLWRRMLRERRKTARRRREALDILQGAMSARSHFDVQLESSKGQPVASFRGACLSATPEGLALALEKGGPAETWPGTAVHVYFRFVMNGTLRFFDFQSTVIRADKQQGATRLLLPLPLVFGNQQRRAFVRYEPAEAFQKTCSLWFGNLLSPPAEDNAPQPAQTLQWLPVPTDHLRVADVSAGGMRLLLPSALDGVWQRLEPGRLLLTQFTLQEPGVQQAASALSLNLANPRSEPEQPPVTVATVMEVLRVIPAATPGTVEAGVHFRRWAQVLPGQKPAWSVTKEYEGIPPLGSWIMRRLGERMRTVGNTAQTDGDFALKLDDDDDD